MSTLRQRVWERDKGVCALCGLETEKLIEAMLARFPGKTRSEAIAACLWDAGLGLGYRTLWHVEHEQPRALGGKDTLENCRTACIKCHQEKTREEDTPRLKLVRRKAKKSARHRARMAQKLEPGPD